MNLETMRSWIATHASESFSRSSGPGGQNVNKVNTKATLRVDLALIEGLSPAERGRLLEKLKNRLVGESIRPDPEGGPPLVSPGTELLIQVQDERSQLQNRELAVERALAIIIAALHRDKPRRATKPSRASQERRVASKKVAGAHKKNRGRPGLD
jgi:ribosome-associated protein